MPHKKVIANCACARDYNGKVKPLQDRVREAPVSNVRAKKDPLVLSVRWLVMLTSSSLRIRSQIFVSPRGNERKQLSKGRKT